MYAAEHFGLSKRQACRYLELPRSTFHYRSRRRDDSPARERLKAIAAQRPRFGCARLHVMLRREGLVSNHKRTERLYREEGLSLRLKKRKRRASSLRLQIPAAQRPDQRWSMDFVAEKLFNGRKFRMLTVVDDFSRECPLIEVDTSLGGSRVARVLDQLIEQRGKPEVITVDNGPEFAGNALDAWAYRHGIKLNFIRPGKPVENAYIESFNGRLRDECLNQNWFASLFEARQIIEDWRRDYNEVRPHSSLANLTPLEFSAIQKAKLNPQQQPAGVTL
jgi:putative transposase